MISLFSVKHVHWNVFRKKYPGVVWYFNGECWIPENHFKTTAQWLLTGEPGRRRYWVHIYRELEREKPGETGISERLRYLWDTRRPTNIQSSFPRYSHSIHYSDLKWSWQQSASRAPNIHHSLPVRQAPSDTLPILSTVQLKRVICSWALFNKIKMTSQDGKSTSFVLLSN